MHGHFQAWALNARAPGLRGLNSRSSLRGYGAGAVFAACAATAAVASSPTLRLQVPFGLLGRPRNAKGCKKKLRLSWLVVDALSGAVGEIAQLVALYPLDTLKVRCQAQGANAGVILRELHSMGASWRTVRTLYAGMGSAALCSAVIGAFYLLAFYTVKRVGNEFAAGLVQRQRSKAAQQQAGASPAAAGGRGQQQQATGSQLADGTNQWPPLNEGGTHPLVASLAGISASVIASVFEAPMETYKLRAQAGAIGSGSMLAAMAGTALTQGLGALYWSYGAFMIKSIPYDFAELVSYSGLCDLREAAAARQQAQRAQAAVAAPALAAAPEPQQLAGSAAVAGLATGAGASTSSISGSSSSSRWQEQLGDLIAGSPNHVGDLIVGATAGAAAVLCSMPCDVVKTHMDLHHHHRPCPPGANGMLHSAAEFVNTGRQLVARGGMGALFVGVTPRLLQTLPSTAVYWWAVEGTRRALMHYVEVEAAPDTTSPSQGEAPQQQPTPA